MSKNDDFEKEYRKNFKEHDRALARNEKLAKQGRKFMLTGEISALTGIIYALLMLLFIFLMNKVDYLLSVKAHFYNMWAELAVFAVLMIVIAYFLEFFMVKAFRISRFSYNLSAFLTIFILTAIFVIYGIYDIKTNSVEIENSDFFPYAMALVMLGVLLLVYRGAVSLIRLIIKKNSSKKK